MEGSYAAARDERGSAISRLATGAFRDGCREQRKSELTLSRICQRSKGKGYTLTFVPRVDTPRWMASLPNETSLASLYIPGTHESLAFYGGPISTCQTSNLPISAQLAKGGVRFLDYRFSLKGGVLKAYHGIQNEYVDAEEAFGYVYRFLDGEGKGEAVIISVKQENGTPAFETALNKLLDKRLDLWYREDRWPTLGEVRGRAVMFCRFGFESSPNGLHPPIWPNNSTEAFATTIGGRDCVIQDWYSIGSFLRIPEKAALVLSLVPPPPSSLPPFENRPIRISFLSGATLLVAFPYIVAKGLGYPAVSSLFGFPGVNQRVLDGLLARGALGEEPGWSKGDGDIGKEGDGQGAPRSEGAEGGMILLTDFWEFPGGLNELFIAWNMVQR
ncbi:PLC-like phosphodiesterase [Leucosporidium creatinivorum]|uniref:PLC-like phosphodiesterase n=1 Tax=Leucosporidium creatinivorum TaxID=106004 RepID=A0A1Y2DIE5_9BASI|nr:PLC-like phosphodiesterase [Leucosporidium creatinivorum]